MANFQYVYILVSEAHPTRHYIGLTGNLNRRLKSHNFDQIRHTSKKKPWRIEIAVAFHSQKKARAFEKYLKSHSGRAFASKRF